MHLISYGAVEKKREAVLDIDLNRLTYHLPSDLNASVWASLKDWQVNGRCGSCGHRMQRYGPARMRTVGWAGLVSEDQLAHIDHLKKLAQEIKSAGFDHVLLLGMGGSSLWK